MQQQAEQSGSDRAIVARMARGDEQALASLYDRFGNLAYSLAYQILGNTADAEEVVTAAFVQAWSTAVSFDPARASVPAWLSMITRTRALDRLRSSKRRSQLLEHDRDLQGTLQTLRAESHERHDVLGYELLAWAEAKAGNAATADGAITAAGRLDTRDGLLHYIAGEVRLANGDSVGARSHLQTALAINPAFHPLLADSARALLRHLER